MVSHTFFHRDGFCVSACVVVDLFNNSGMARDPGSRTCLPDLTTPRHTGEGETGTQLGFPLIVCSASSIVRTLLIGGDKPW